MKPRTRRRPSKQRPGDPLWFKDAVFYQMRIASFADSDGDGIGDFRGALAKIDYLHDLGVNTLWMLPFYPSPARDDGYDIADYMNIAPQYGTLDDFRAFMDAARARDMHVITELVVNHTSDQHAWFQRARRAPKGSPERDFYVWSDDNTKYSDVRIIFGDFEPSNWTWDPVAEQFYWHRFYHHQPDLNFDNPLVHDAVLGALDFWMDMGVDGVRLDAIPYLYEREGGNGESLPETHAFIKKMRAHAEARHPGKVLLAEANQWPEAMVDYFGNGDECNMAFHFPLMPRLYLALRNEERYPIVDIMTQTPAIPDTCQWALFLRNHDELTLEMVTEEERETMRRAYAPEKPMRVNLGIRRRLATMFNGDRRALEVMNALLFSLPGTPIVYYGDEIGMGDNVYLHDRNGVRTPMQWSPDRNAGFSSANPQRLLLPPITDPAYHYEAINVELQQANPASLLWWMKRMIAVRRRYRAFGRGSIEFLAPANGKILAFIRRYQDADRDETILCVVNLSRHPQSVALDLRAFDGVIPIELFGGSAFPAIGADGAYTLTMGGHNFYWFELPPRVESELAADERATLTVRGSWHTLFDAAFRPELTEALAGYLLKRPELARRAAALQSAAYEDAHGLGRAGALTLIRLRFSDEGEDALYLLNLTYAPAEGAEAGLGEPIADVQSAEGRGILIDAGKSALLHGALLDAIHTRHTLAGMSGSFIASTTERAAPDQAERLDLLSALDAGSAPALEFGRRFAGQGNVPVVPLLGTLEYLKRGGDEAITVALLFADLTTHQSIDGVIHDRLIRFYEERLAAKVPAPVLTGDALALSFDAIPESINEAVGGDTLVLARQIGTRLAHLHSTLADSKGDPAFAPEPYGLNYQRALYQSLFNMTTRTVRAAAAYHRRGEADPIVRFSTAETRILTRLKRIVGRKIDGMRVRTHGALDLAHIVRSGDDLRFVGFGDDQTIPLTERRLKRSPLRDVAALMRAFDLAALLTIDAADTRVAPDVRPFLRSWAHVWRAYVNAAVLQGYFAAIAPGVIPKADSDRRLVLETALIERLLMWIDRAIEMDDASTGNTRLVSKVELLLGELDADASL